MLSYRHKPLNRRSGPPCATTSERRPAERQLRPLEIGRLEKAATVEHAILHARRS